MLFILLYDLNPIIGIKISNFNTKCNTLKFFFKAGYSLISKF